MTRVKVCGITNLDDARLCVDAGADALGFIFVEKTPRFVTPEQVAPIVRWLPPFVTPVGVFWDHPSGHVKAVAEACRLRALQFHGDEPPEELAGYGLPVIKTIKIPPMSTIGGLPEYRIGGFIDAVKYRAVASALLLDTATRWSEGEAREPIAWKRIAMMGGRHDARVSLILSGGLNPDNVAEAISIVHPWAVDVNSGVEARPGKKDADKVRRFMQQVRAAA
ncbi:MAG TPA: phosphoribosylanthranilate isomerase [Methylomirabilota bacterium]|jgi:phosphoribosylanthranilate isomerase|nr:phosphoribosylanthranilate isomerase [Methylomirabilota bacterium]